MSDVRYKEQRVQHYQTYMENVDVVNNRFMLHLTSEDLNKNCPLENHNEHS